MPPIYSLGWKADTVLGGISGPWGAWGGHWGHLPPQQIFGHGPPMSGGTVKLITNTYI